MHTTHVSKRFIYPSVSSSWLLIKQNVRIEAVLRSSKVLLPSTLIVFEGIPYDITVAIVTVTALVATLTGDITTVTSQ